MAGRVRIGFVAGLLINQRPHNAGVFSRLRVQGFVSRHIGLAVDMVFVDKIHNHFRQGFSTKAALVRGVGAIGQIVHDDALFL